ncbi:hypothetical protein ACJ6WH_00085 [Stenotrophomonas maltophilia]|uniref:hypothetical protein n=1 Tax=Stenotrophomonas maltophilia TaxID=40324 RepID=UPI0013121900
MISRKLLCAATLACLAPFAASAADAYLTPSKNGGSGNMPSGYSHVYFELADNDWVGRLSLPAHPRNGDRVTLSSLAGRDVAGASYSALLANKTVFADHVYIPVDNLSNVVFRWTDKYARWDVIDGVSGRMVVGRNQDTLRIENSEHVLTQVNLFDTRRAAQVELPSWAPNGALLVVANASNDDVRVNGGPASLANSNCTAGSNCGFVFGADGAWHVRKGSGVASPAAQLPVPEKRWTQIAMGNLATDPAIPREIGLPSEAVCGDVYTMITGDDTGFTRVKAENTNTPSGVTLRRGIRYMYRFDGAKGIWEMQRVR